jgi:hypothetical protein
VLSPLLCSLYTEQRRGAFRGQPFLMELEFITWWEITRPLFQLSALRHSKYSATASIVIDLIGHASES